MAAALVIIVPTLNSQGWSWLLFTEPRAATNLGASGKAAVAVVISPFARSAFTHTVTSTLQGQILNIAWTFLKPPPPPTIPLG